MRNMITILALTVSLSTNAQNSTNKSITMKLNAGIITEKMELTKKFYTETLGFNVAFENEFYLLLNTPDNSTQISFLLPNHPSQRPIFQKPFNGQGVYLTIEVSNVDLLYEKMKKKGIAIEIELRDEPWGDRHFAVVDPNGIGIDFVTYAEPEKN